MNLDMLKAEIGDVVRLIRSYREDLQKHNANLHDAFIELGTAEVAVDELFMARPSTQPYDLWQRTNAAAIQIAMDRVHAASMKMREAAKTLMWANRVVNELESLGEPVAELKAAAASVGGL